jgi:hypothetical protein
MSKWTEQPKSGGGNGEDRPLAPAGNQPAVLVAMVDLGTQENSYQGKVSKNRKLYLVWELVDAPGRPLVGKDFTRSLHEKALLRRFVDSWRGKPLANGEDFDLSKLVGQPCMLDVQHHKSKDGKKTYAVVEGASSVPILKGKRVEVTKPEHGPFAWHLDDGGEGKLPDWLPYLYGRSVVEWIMDSEERKDGKREPGEEGDEEGADSGFGPAPVEGAEIPF